VEVEERSGIIHKVKNPDVIEKLKKEKNCIWKAGRT